MISEHLLKQKDVINTEIMMMSQIEFKQIVNFKREKSDYHSFMKVHSLSQLYRDRDPSMNDLLFQSQLYLSPFKVEKQRETADLLSLLS